MASCMLFRQSSGPPTPHFQVHLFYKVLGSSESEQTKLIPASAKKGRNKLSRISTVILSSGFPVSWLCVLGVEKVTKESFSCYSI